MAKPKEAPLRSQNSHPESMFPTLGHCPKPRDGRTRATSAFLMHKFVIGVLNVLVEEHWWPRRHLPRSRGRTAAGYPPSAVRTAGIPRVPPPQCSHEKRGEPRGTIIIRPCVPGWYPMRKHQALCFVMTAGRRHSKPVDESTRPLRSKGAPDAICVIPCARLRRVACRKQ